METSIIIAVVLWGLFVVISMGFRFLTGLARDLDKEEITREVVTCTSVDLVLRAIFLAILPLGASVVGMTLPARAREFISQHIAPSDIPVACVIAIFASFVAIRPLKDAWKGGIRDRLVELLKPQQSAQQDGGGQPAARRKPG